MKIYEERIVNLGKLEDGRNAVIWLYPNGNFNLSVVSGFDDTQRIGEKWSGAKGHYMNDVVGFAKSVIESQFVISYDRLLEIARHAIESCGVSEWAYDEFTEVIELTPEEKIVFGITGEED